MKKLSTLMLVILLFVSQFTASILPVRAAVIALNNDSLRFGDGGDSINGTGLLNQPFYYNASYGWRQLTFSSYPLDYQIGVDGDGTSNWNLNGTISLNPNLSNLVIDTSYGYTSVVEGKGYGNLVTSGTVDIGGKTLKVTQTYQLPEGKAFIKVTTKVENITTGLTDNKVTNLRFWLGTQDDYIGGSDTNTKTKGNLVDGAFQAISSQSTPAKALQISSGVESVLFFTDTDKANTIIGTRYGWYNVSNINPVNSPMSYTSDGSYAFYVRFNDLEANESDQFTWYYAAGEISKIADIIKDVSDAATAVGNVTPDSATLSVSTPTASTGYYLVVPRGSQVPTAEQIYTGENYGGVTIFKHGSVELAANTPTNLAITGLQEGSQYDVYFVTRALSGESVTYSSVSVTQVNTPLNPLIGVADITSIDIPRNHRVPDTDPIETETYTATVAWNPNDAYFNDGVSYTATITITPKPGYTLTGLEANTIKVNGATVTHAANSGVLTAVFPAVVLDKVIFHAQGGSSVASQSTDYDALVSLPANPTYPGYAFMGWYTEAAYTTAWDFENDLMPAHDLDLYAKWAAQDQIVTFHANGGIGDNAIQIAKTDSRTALDEQTFTRTGYSFSGWALSNTATTPVYEANEAITWFNTNTDLYAVWTPNNQIVTFYANGGVGANETQSAKTDSQTALKTTAFTRTGYSLIGWDTSATATTPTYDPTATITWFNANTSLYAIWSADDQTVTFHANGGVGNNETQIAKAESQAILNETDFTRTGYSLIGWAKSPSGSIAFEPQETITWFNTATDLYAIWSAKDQTVTFHANGGVGSNATQIAKTDSRTALDEQTFTRTGYTFSGWALTSDATTALYESNDTITWFNASTDLYAVWAPNNQTVTFHANGGVGDNATQIAKTDSRTALDEQTYSRTGYTFSGWALSSSAVSAKYEASETITWFNTNTDLYAVWSADDQTVTFKPNGGVGLLTTQVAKTDSETVLDANPFSRVGFHFLGWSLDPEATEVDYTESETITWFDTAETLYAIWGINYYDVTFDSQGGTLIPKQTLPYQSYVVKPADPTRTGYRFTGWSDSTSAYGFDLPLTSALTLSAGWDIIRYGIQTDYAGGSGNNPESYTITDSITLNSPVREGYRFLGWLEGNTQITVIAPGRTGDIRLTATWQFVPADPKLGSTQVTDVNESGATLKTSLISLGNPKANRFGYELTDLSSGSVSEFTTASDLRLTLNTLEPYTAYEVRAFASNGPKTVYASSLSFTTLPLDTDKDGIPDQRDSAPQDPTQSYDPGSLDLSRTPVLTFTGVPESVGSDALLLKLEAKDLLGLKPEDNLQIIMGTLRFTVPAAIADQWLKQSQDPNSRLSFKVIPGLSDDILESKLKADFGKKPLAILDYQLLRIYSDGREEAIHQLEGQIQVEVSLKDTYASYDPETMGIYYYNPKTGSLEAIASQYDPEGQRLVFMTDHFSYYVLSAKADSVMSLDNLPLIAGGLAFILFLLIVLLRRRKHVA